MLQHAVRGMYVPPKSVGFADESVRNPVTVRSGIRWLKARRVQNQAIDVETRPKVRSLLGVILRNGTLQGHESDS